MHRFSTDREALDFIASRIAEQAERDHVAFSEVERKMLYFSEKAWTLPDILEVSDKFDRNYDQSVYEKKVSQLIQNAVAHARRYDHGELEVWIEAIRRLRKEDRYLLVMVDHARLGLKFHRSSSRVLRRLEALAIVGALLFFGLVWLINKRFPETNLPGGARGRFDFAYWLAMGCLAVIAEVVLQLSRLSRSVSRALDWMLGVRERRR